MTDQAKPQMEEKDVILNSAKGLLEIGMGLKEVNGAISALRRFVA